MARTVRDALLKAFDDLSEGSFKRFRNKLSDWEVREGFRKIPRGRLENADREDVVDLILRYYMYSYGPELMVDILDIIKESQVALELKKNLKNVSRISALNATSSRFKDYGHSGTQSQDLVRFVNQHFMDLIREVTVVDPILNDLLQQHLLTQEQCDEIRSNPTSQKKMREFYTYVRAWNDDKKVILYKLLRKHNELLINYLDHQDKQPSPARTEHFVDKHREELIQRIPLIEPVLDDLLQWGLLTSEQYDRMRTEPTIQNKMRVLYEFTRGWNNSDKDFLYNLLRKTNGPLTRDLEEEVLNQWRKPEMKHFVDRHRRDLIKWVYELQPVLDSLLMQKLLTKKKYDSICSKTTPQEKMRELYCVVRGWSTDDKDKLYETLGKYNRLLIRDLEYKDMQWPLTSRSSSMSLDQSKWTPKDLLLYSLEYLLLDEFSLFKKELSSFVYNDRSASPLGQLADEGSMYISDQLIAYYGDFTALDVTVQVLKLVGLMRFAEELQEDINLCGLRTPEVILVYILDKLEQYNFMQFKNNLSELCEEDKRPFPQRLKDSADRITTVDLLILLNGKQEALNVTVQILQNIDVMRLARDLENWILPHGSKKYAGFHQGEVGASKLTEDNSSVKPGSSKDFDFQAGIKVDPDQCSVILTGAEAQVSSKEENAQSTRNLSDLRREMECPVCIDILSDPTTLMCGHNFCMKCIERALDNQKENNFFCPVCKQKYENRPKLKINYVLRKLARFFKSRLSKYGDPKCTYCIEDPGAAVKSCLLCETSLCDAHLNVHSKTEEHILIEPTTSFKERKCSIHNKVLEHYCTNDDVYVCSECCIYGDHRGHQVEKVTEAAEKKKNYLRHVQEELGCKKIKIEELLKSFTEAQKISAAEQVRKLLEVLELSPGDTSTQESQASFSVSDLIQKAEERKNQLSKKIDDIINMCQETDPILFLQERKDECVSSLQQGDWFECELCGKDEDSAFLVLPVINGMLCRLELLSAGLFRCSKTGIKFEVTRPVTIEYEVEPWSSYGSLILKLHNGYEILGPLFNIKTDLEPGVVSAVYLPHCLCLKGFKEDTSCIKCAHFKDDNLTLEAPTRVEPYYVVLENPTFSARGVLLYPLTWIKDGITKLLRFHGMVLIYWRISGITNPNHRKFRIHLYLMPHNKFVETDIDDKETKDQKEPYYKLRKPHQTGALYNGRTYEVKASQNGRVLPKMLEFQCSYVSGPYPYTLITVDDKETNEDIAISIEDGDSSVWQAEVDTGDMDDLQTKLLGFPLQGDQMEYMDEHQIQQRKASMEHGGFSWRDLLKSILKDMKEKSIKEFKSYLNDGDFLQPCKPIPESDLEHADHIDVADLLITHYRKEEVSDVTIRILKAIGEVNRAEKLKSMIGIK